VDIHQPARFRPPAALHYSHVPKQTFLRCLALPHPTETTGLLVTPCAPAPFATYVSTRFLRDSPLYIPPFTPVQCGTHWLFGWFPGLVPVPFVALPLDYLYLLPMPVTDYWDRLRTPFRFPGCRAGYPTTFGLQVIPVALPGLDLRLLPGYTTLLPVPVGCPFPRPLPPTGLYRVEFTDDSAVRMGDLLWIHGLPCQVSHTHRFGLVPSSPHHMPRLDLALLTVC